MNDKIFELLNKYYAFSKKYIPLINLGIFVIMIVCKLSTALCFGVYFALLLLHVFGLAIIQRVVKNHVQKQLLNLDSVKEVFENVQEDSKDN